MLHDQGRAVRGKVVLRRDASDLALIELEKLPDGITALPLAEQPAGAGECVHSVGQRQDSEALWNHCTGEVRQVGRLTDGYFWRGKKLASNVPCLITQSPILPGDSGGAIVNEKGKVVGVLSGLRPAPLAAIVIQVSEVRDLLAQATKAKAPDEPGPPRGTEVYRKLLGATVWVRPMATEGRAAGWVVDRGPGLLLTTNSGAGPSDLVDVLIPRFEKFNLVAELSAYGDRIGLRQQELLVRGIVLHRDPRRDLALIEVDWPLAAHMGKLALAKVEPRPAEKVHALSHPSGVELLWLYSSGTIRQAANLELVASSMGEAVKARCLLLQIPQQSSSSGGPVANENGQVVGMLAAKEGAQQQLGYAIGATELQAFIDEARPLFAPETEAEFHRRGLLYGTRCLKKEGIRCLLEEFKRGDNQRRGVLVGELTDLLLRAGDLPEAQRIFEMIQNPLLVPNYRARRAVFDAHAGEAERVRQECAELLKQDSKCARAYLARGLLSLDKDALADLDEAIFLAPDFVEAYRRRAAVHDTLGNDDKAVADYSRAIELDPYEPETIRKRANIYLKKNEPKRAVADYERLIELAPRDAQSYRGLARAWLAQGDEAKALPGVIGALRWDAAVRQSIMEDVLKHGEELVRRWPDDSGKRTAWYKQALESLRPIIADEKIRRQIDDALQSKKKEWDEKTWADEMEKRIKALAR
jgi:tetratricopeptide (TPR) repeat protein